MARINRPLERRVIEAARRKFVPGNRYGVFAFDIGSPIHCGRRSRGRTLRVYVKRKSPSAPAVPTLTVTSGRRRVRIRPDVIATGAEPRANDSEELAFTGLHAGAAVKVKHRSGAVSVLLSDGTHPRYALLAGHLFAPDEAGQAVRGARRDGPLRIIGSLVSNLLDERPSGLTFAIDVALIELSDFGRELVVSTAAPKAPTLTSIAKTTSAAGMAVQAYRPTANDYSEQSALFKLSQCVVTSSARPLGYVVQDVLCTEQEITRSGDSGTILVAAASQTAGVGSCIGVNGRGTMLEPVDRALRYFAEQIPELTLWVGEQET